jgi:hypothetical protein
VDHVPLTPYQQVFMSVSGKIDEPVEERPYSPESR